MERREAGAADGPGAAARPGSWWDTRWPVVGAAGAAVVAVVLGVVAASGPAPAWETEVVDAMARLPDAVGIPLRAVMEAGTLPVVVAAALAVRLVGHRWRPALTVALVGVSAWLLARAGKPLVGRGRPTGVRVREVRDGFGYPSGHTAVAFALAVAFAAMLPRRWRWLPFLAAAMVGVARVHVGAHYPLDVVGGAALGLAAGLAVVAAEHRSRPGQRSGDPGPGDSRPLDTGAPDRPAA